MLGARLFFIAGWVFLALSLLMHNSAVSGLDVYLHDHYFVIGPSHFSALCCWIYSALYYAGVRFAGLRFSRLLLIIHFIVTMLALLPNSFVRFVGNARPEKLRFEKLFAWTGWLFPFAGKFLFLSVAVFIVVVILAAIRRAASSKTVANS